ncbi:uncharacterized protein LOC143343483 [Colletes latitarsis]|uniref:uncharacterized protein LOC143343483 n=1 Tax=Colletes latitarsis TaxID=2605962 RepID=UPI0040353C73
MLGLLSKNVSDVSDARARRKASIRLFFSLLPKLYELTKSRIRSFYLRHLYSFSNNKLRETSAFPPPRQLIHERYRAQRGAISRTLKINLGTRVRTYRRFATESLIGIRNQEIPFRNTRRVGVSRPTNP